MKVRNITAGVALTLLGIAPGAFAFNPRVAQRQQTSEQRGANRMRGLDRDGNGVITRDEWPGNDKSFRKRDRNGDGVISAEDRRGNRNSRLERDDDDDRGHGRNKAKHHREDRDDEDDD